MQSMQYSYHFYHLLDPKPNKEITLSNLHHVPMELKGFIRPSYYTVV
jgi:hypothetical protein